MTEFTLDERARALSSWDARLNVLRRLDDLTAQNKQANEELGDYTPALVDGQPLYRFYDGLICAPMTQVDQLGPMSGWRPLYERRSEQPTEPRDRDVLAELFEAADAAGLKLTFDPRRNTAPHRTHRPVEHPAHDGLTCEEYEQQRGELARAQATALEMSTFYGLLRSALAQLHRAVPAGEPDAGTCVECSVPGRPRPWPCPTAQLLDATGPASCGCVVMAEAWVQHDKSTCAYLCRTSDLHQHGPAVTIDGQGEPRCAECARFMRLPGFEQEGKS